MVSQRCFGWAFGWSLAAASACFAAAGKFGNGYRPGESFASAPPPGTLYDVEPITIELWAKTSDRANLTPLLGYQPRSSIGHWELYADKGTGTFTAAFTGYKPSPIATTIDVSDGKWHYLAMQFDRASVRLFVDGRKAADRPVARLPGYDDNGPLTFGHIDRAGSARDLTLDEVRVSRTLRPVDQVPEAPFTPDADTVGLWHFDEDDGSSGYADASSTRNRARLATQDESVTSVSPSSTRWQEEDHGPFFSSTLGSPLPRLNETPKAISVRLGPDHKAGMALDTELLRVSAAWTGGFVKLYPGRDGLAQHPDPDGTVEFGTGPALGWSKGGQFADPRADHAGPLAPERARYKGLYLNGEQVVFAYAVYGVDVLESFGFESREGRHAFTRTIEMAPAKDPLTMLLAERAGAVARADLKGGAVALDKDGRLTAAASTGEAIKLDVRDGSRLCATVPAHEKRVRFKLFLWTGSTADADAMASLVSASPAAADLSSLTHGGPAHWTPPVVTQGQVAAAREAYVVDTLTAPDENPWHSYLRFSGIDFFKNGDAAVCSISGDVWRVSGIDRDLSKLTWKRYATGLFQPLGLKIVDETVYVLGRDQITRLHDLNGDGEADFYENFNNGCKVTPGGHEYCTSLETDPQGNFYYTKCGNPTPHGGTMLKVSKDGSTCEVFAVGLRNPNGMMVSPIGIVTTSDNEGEWVPASRIDWVHPGQFLGFTPMAHGPTPNSPGFPIWIPHSVDNSSGGQVWVTGGRWGPLEGEMLHTSYGASSLFHIMPEVVDGRLQGGTWKFPLKFASGIMRGRFNPADGQLYVCGLKGWQTNGIRDGALHRVRFTGKTPCIPLAVNAYQNGLRLTFTAALDEKTALDAESWGVSRWNYHWTSAYGSKDWSVAHPDRQGHDDVTVKSIRLSKDRKSVFLEIPTIAPVMQMEVQYNLLSDSGEPMEDELYETIHSLRPALSADDLEKPVSTGEAAIK